MRAGFLAAGLVLAVLWSCAPAPEKPKPEPEKEDRLTFSPADQSLLEGWQSDDMAGALNAFRKSCNRWKKWPADRSLGANGIAGKVRDWSGVCASAGQTNDARRFFADNFILWRAENRGQADGLFTGYYEPELKGSRTRSGTHVWPVHGRPDDLVLVSLGNWRDSLKGERIAGRVVSGRLRPYDSREKIRGGSIDGKAPVLAYVEDPVGLFFTHIQGSGRIALEDGSILRIGYDGHNGHTYYAIGRYLVREGHIPKKDISLQSIRAWLLANPDRMHEVMDLNPSYIFFRELTGDGPLGAMGVALTPGRSLAIDRRFIPLGIPLWVDIEYADKQGQPLQRMMVAQDTGGAIRGPVRGDVFWGAGDDAEWLAGHMKASGQYYLLLPRGMRPVVPTS